VPALAPGQARRLTTRAVRAGCGLPAQRAARADARYGTQGFTWLAGHDPSALIAWGVPAAQLEAVAPDARVQLARGRDRCRQAAAAKAALFVLLPRGRAAQAPLSEALDCGIALYRDARVVIIAPR
jgi:hypothetical protein